jgi:predicted RNA-binding Zn-ribbon protein involved in translation (DUF1610 family)
MAQHNRQCKTCNKDFVTDRDNYFQCPKCFKKANEEYTARKKSGGKNTTSSGGKGYGPPRSSGGGGGYGPSKPAQRRGAKAEPARPKRQNTKYKAEPARPTSPVKPTPERKPTPSNGRVAKIHVTFELDEAWLTEHIVLPVVKSGGGQIDLDVKSNDNELKALREEVELLKEKVERYQNVNIHGFEETPEDNEPSEDPIIQEVEEVEEAPNDEPTDEVSIDEEIDEEFGEDEPPF